MEVELPSSPAQDREENADSYHPSFMMSVLSGRVLSASWQSLTAFSSYQHHCERVPDLYQCSKHASFKYLVQWKSRSGSVQFN